VVRSGSGELHSTAYGTPETAWAAAAEMSSQVHMRGERDVVNPLDRY
jgi:hypothetical protein